MKYIDVGFGCGDSCIVFAGNLFFYLFITHKGINLNELFQDQYQSNVTVSLFFSSLH